MLFRKIEATIIQHLKSNDCFLIIHKLFSIDALNVVFPFLDVNPYSFNCTSNQLFISIFQ